MTNSGAGVRRPGDGCSERRARRSRLGRSSGEARQGWVVPGRPWGWFGADRDSGAWLAGRFAAGRVREADGFVGGFEGLLFGLLLFVAGTLLIGYAWGVVDTKAATEEAARQAARTYVEASSATLAGPSARSAAATALAGYGRDPNRATVGVAVGSFGRCERVTISVGYPAPLLALPFVGRVGSGQDVRADNSELVDPYRSGLPGTATCG
jgi:hypothetical protein